MGENTFGSAHPSICVFVYALPFKPVVRSRSILVLGLPSSANGNCEWSLPVHWNCLFVSNQGVFNVSRVSGRSALILLAAIQCRRKYTQLFAIHILTYTYQFWFIYLNICENCHIFCNINFWMLAFHFSLWQYSLTFTEPNSLHYMKPYSKCRSITVVSDHISCLNTIR